MLRSVVLSLAIAACATSLEASAQPDMRSVPVVDPVLQMPAWSLALPAGWTADATMMPGTSCSPVTTPVYRATSADGKAGVYFLPRVDWAWGPAARPGADCLPVHEELSARNYLTSLIRSRGVGYVGDEPVPELAELRRNFAAQDRQSGGMRHSTADMARYRVRYEVNGQPVEEMDTVTTICSDAVFAAIGHQYSCSALATRWYAPLGQLQAMLPTMEAMKLTLNPQWMGRWTSLMSARSNDRSRQQTEALLQQGRLAQAARTKEHQAFMTSMERGRDIRNQQFKEHLFQKQHQSDDFVDYIVGCQRAYSGNNRVSVGSNCPNRQTY